MIRGYLGVLLVDGLPFWRKASGKATLPQRDFASLPRHSVVQERCSSAQPFRQHRGCCKRPADPNQSGEEALVRDCAHPAQATRSGRGRALKRTGVRLRPVVGFLASGRRTWRQSIDCTPFSAQMSDASTLRPRSAAHPLLVALSVRAPCAMSRPFSCPHFLPCTLTGRTLTHGCSSARLILHHHQAHQDVCGAPIVRVSGISSPLRAQIHFRTSSALQTGQVLRVARLS